MRPVCAQTEIQLGGSTLQDAFGGSVTRYGESSSWQIGGGEIDGEGLGSASFHRKRRCDTFLGDHQIFEAVQGAGVSVPLLGMSLECKSKNRDIVFFGGATGNAVSTGFIVPAVIPSHAGAGYLFRRDIGRFEFANIGLTSGTELGSIRWKDSHYTLSATAGLLQRAWYSALNADARWKYLDVEAGHDTLVYGGLIKNLETAAVSGGAAGINLHASVFNAGEAIGVSFSRERFTVNVDYFKSKQTFTVYGSTERGQRWHLTQSVTVEPGNPLSFGIGGGYSGRNWTVDVSRQTLYYPFAGQFQNTYVASFSLALAHGIQFAASTLALPTGTKMTATVDDIFGNGPQAREQYHSIGKYEISGSVMDATGAAIEGACVRIGKELAYTDASGQYMVRVPHNQTYPLTVLPDEFIEGRWRIVEAPATVAPGKPAKVVVTRL